MTLERIFKKNLQQKLQGEMVNIFCNNWLKSRTLYQISKDAKDWTTQHDTYGTEHPTNADYASSWSANRTLTKTEYMLSHNASLNKFQRTEVIQSMCFKPQWN